MQYYDYCMDKRLRQLYRAVTSRRRAKRVADVSQSTRRNPMRAMFKRAVATAAVSVVSVAAAAQPVPVVGLVELSGSGATAGTNFNNGAKLAVKEINAAGGFGGRPIEYTANDTQTNPGTAKALAAKAIDGNAYIVVGPVFSGSILVSMNETRRAEIPNIIGGEAAAITEQGNPYVFR